MKWTQRWVKGKYMKALLSHDFQSCLLQVSITILDLKPFSCCCERVWLGHSPAVFFMCVSWVGHLRNVFTNGFRLAHPFTFTHLYSRMTHFGVEVQRSPWPHVSHDISGTVGAQFRYTLVWTKHLQNAFHLSTKGSFLFYWRLIKLRKRT